jgi:hypothetical protein
MARGGARPGSGPAKGAKYGKRDEMKPAVVKREARAEGMTPLEYMLDVMNDDSADAARRDRMAQAAAPYVHGRVADTAKGKKEQAQEDAGEIASAGKFAPRSAPRLAVSNG